MLDDSAQPTEPPVTRELQIEDNPFWPVLGNLDQWARAMTHMVSELVGDRWDKFTYHDPPFVKLRYGTDGLLDCYLHVTLYCWEPRVAGKGFTYVRTIDPQESTSRGRALACLSAMVEHMLDHFDFMLTAHYLKTEPDFLSEYVRHMFLTHVGATRIRNFVERSAFRKSGNEYTFAFVDQALNIQGFTMPVAEAEAKAQESLLALNRFLAEQAQKFLCAYHELPETLAFSQYIGTYTPEELAEKVAAINADAPPIPMYPDDQSEYTNYNTLQEYERRKRFWRIVRQRMDEANDDWEDLYG